jgi:REP-associated tyrosine transposase
LFQGRYQGILVEKDAYLLELARYRVLNPVRAGMVTKPEDWPWSSYRATLGIALAARFLFTDWLLGAFGEERATAVEGYRRFVTEGEGMRCPWDDRGPQQTMVQLQVECRMQAPRAARIFCTTLAL